MADNRISAERIVALEAEVEFLRAALLKALPHVDSDGGSTTEGCRSADPAEGDSACAGSEDSASEQACVEDPDPSLPSRGSALHSSGCCEPCAWFWKPQGCENGSLCCRCHLCPEGEVKKRKKEKLAAMRTATHDSQSGDAVREIAAPEALVEAIIANVASVHAANAMKAEAALPPPPPPYMPPPPPPGLLPPPPPYVAMPPLAEPVAEEQQREPLMPQLLSGAVALTATAGLPAPPGLAAPLGLSEPVPSCGSAMHRIGQCQPCAWFWKPQGCSNGAECRRCHLCPAGEVKRRKQMKVAILRSACADIEQ